jgi:hypothetical protein
MSYMATTWFGTAETGRSCDTMMRMILMASMVLIGTAADAQQYFMRVRMNGMTTASTAPATQTPTPSPEPTWTHCARESSPCALPAGGTNWTVRYGVPGKWTYKQFSSPNGLNVPCDNYTFPDPAHEINKDCFRSADAA